MSTADFKLDARVRDVPVPDGLLARLMALPLADDEGIDALVREVAVPAGLVERLQALALADDEGLDEALRDVAVPDDLVASCHQYVRRYIARLNGRHPTNRSLPIMRIAMAASIIMAVTLSLASAVLFTVIVNRFSRQEARELPPDPPRTVPLVPVEKPLETSWGVFADDSTQLDYSPELNVAVGHSAASLQPGVSRQEIELAEIEPLAEWASRDLRLPLGAQPLGQSPGVLGMNRWDDLPELPISPTSPVPHGLDWPMEQPANRPFLQRWNFHPFVSPAASPRLQTCPVPLAIETGSYELGRRYLERNEWPPADRIRTEEFLAAVDYNFPKPTSQGLGLTVAGGPSPISGEGFCLLQVGVQARQIDVAQHAPVHLVLLIDTSTSMRWGSRMEIVRRALGDLPGIVAAEDRLSLVTFNQAAHVLVENLGHDALRPFLAAADSLSAEGATNIVAGLREAYGRARPMLGPGRPSVRVVLVTDGLLDLEPATTEKIEQEVAAAAKENIPLEVIDLGQQKETDPQVLSLSRAGGGTVHRAVSAAEVRWALREIVTGRSQLVARAARLQVAFNPMAVLEYRLVGHESGDWGGLLPGPLEADFREGQAATALFEVRLAPNGPDNLASAELTWYTPDGAKTLGGRTAEKVRMMVERRHFAASLSSSAPSLQEAAVVAYAAEVLRHSPFIFQRQPGLNVPAALRRAVELSGQVDSQLQMRPSFDEFVALLRQEMKAHPAKRSAKD